MSALIGDVCQVVVSQGGDESCTAADDSSSAGDVTGTPHRPVIHR